MEFSAAKKRQATTNKQPGKRQNVIYIECFNDYKLDIKLVPNNVRGFAASHNLR